MSNKNQSEDLIRQIRAGKRPAMDQLLKRWYPKIVNYAWRFTGDRGAAEDIGQQAFVQVFRKLHQLKDPARFHIWLYRIADNQCKDYLRRRKKYESIDQEVIQEKPSLRQNAQQTLEKQEQIQWLKKALLKLPEEQRIVIVMKEYQGLKFREIAAILELPVNTVKSRMYKGLKALKKSLIGHPLKKESYYE